MTAVANSLTTASSQRRGSLGSASQRSDRTWGLCASLWIASYFLVEVTVGGSSIALYGRVIFAAPLVAIMLRELGGGVQRRAFWALGAGMIGIGLIVFSYDFIRSTAGWGEPNSYLFAGLRFALAYGVTYAFAVLGFEQRAFTRAYVRIASASVLVAVAGWAVSAFGGVTLLVNQRGAPRLQGLLSEPSAWAPVCASLFLVGFQRRSGKMMALALLCGALTSSPTVIIVIAVSVLVYFLAVEARSAKSVVLAAVLAGLVAVAASFLVNADARDYLGTGNPANEVVARLILGIDSVESGGSTGRNARVDSSLAVLSEVSDLGSGMVGLGPDAHSVYFPSKFPSEDGGSAFLPNSILLVAVFDFGYLGAGLLIAALALTFVRLRRRPELAAIFIPFILAAALNSAQGSELYKWPVLAILVTLGLPASARIARSE